jgi:CheY-like chemotaxis protein
MDYLSRSPLVRRKKKKSCGGGKKSKVQTLTRIEVSLDGLEVELALGLGDGDLTLGIRRAIIFASMRQWLLFLQCVYERGMAAKKKILVVEDNPDIRQLMVFFLEQTGYDVLVAATGLGAIEQASATLPDLITMDLGLPDITGDEATARLKADPSTKHIPVIVVTAYYKESPLVESAVAAGACEVLCKPITLRSLEDALRRLLTVKPNEGALAARSLASSSNDRLTDHT